MKRLIIVLIWLRLFMAVVDTGLWIAGDNAAWNRAGDHLLWAAVLYLLFQRRLEND